MTPEAHDSGPDQASLEQIQRLIDAGALAAAEAACQELLRAAPRHPLAWFRLGVVVLSQGRAAEAETAFRQSLALDAEYAGAWNNLSIALRELQRPAEAEAASRQALAMDPSNASHWLNLGNAIYSQGRWEDAGSAYRRSLALNPRDPGAWSNLGAVEQRRGRLADARAAYERSLALTPDHLGARTNYACLLAQCGRPQQALDMAQSVLAAEKRMTQAWIAVGNAQMALGNLGEAEAAYRRALELAPRHREAGHNLALVLSFAWRLSEAEGSSSSLLAADPDYAPGWAVLGGIQQAQGRAEEALAALRQSVAIAPDPDRHSKLLLGMQYVDGLDPGQLLAEHQKWAAAYAPLPASPPPAAPRRLGPLRLGFVSGDFGQHPTGYMVLPALEALDKSRCQIVCYSDRLTEDSFTARCRTAADVWRDSGGLTVEELAEQIRADEIDVLFDLMGHAGKRLLAFARRPAPVQVTWFGYVGTTGLAAIDFLLADRFHVPEGEERFYVERVLRMPGGYACYGPPEDAPQVGPLPALAGVGGRGSGVGRAEPSLALRASDGTPTRFAGAPVPATFTFGCFNNPSKISPRVLDAWAAILHRVPAARLLLKYGGLHEPAVQAHLAGRFAERGIDPQRILFEGWSPHRQLMAAYNRVDLAFDTQPYSGGLTTCEALWMGVPVVTCAGRTFAGRHAVSHLTSAGYQQFVAADMSGYVELAVGWAGRLEELAAIRGQMREQVRRSGLCDAQAFARDLLNVLTAALT